MKKKTITLLAAMLALSIGMTSALAADETRGRNAADADDRGICGAAFADANGDGICDNCPNGGIRPQDGTGRRAGRNGAGCGAAFADANGDGICDNCPNGGIRPQDGTGRRAGRRCGGNR